MKNLKELLKTHGSSNKLKNPNLITVCHILPFQFKDALRAAKFSMDGNDYSFDEYGDINSGYEVIVWRDQRSSMDMNNIIGYFDIQTQKLIFNTHVKDIRRHMVSLFYESLLFYFFISHAH